LKRLLQFLLCLTLVFAQIILLGTITAWKKNEKSWDYETACEYMRSQPVTEEQVTELMSICENDRSDFSKRLAYFYLTGGESLISLQESGEYEKALQVLPVAKKKQLEQMAEYVYKIWSDIVYFPIPLSSSNPQYTVSFENSWLFERTFGGVRGHEGTDIMASENTRGVYPVISSSNGVVEQLGWLEKGGYRIGIRSENGAYFYYAHLESYAQDIQKGDTVEAGQLLGFVGDTGYGSEGTTGKFPVHLHFGIYISTAEQEELSVNPYPVLLYCKEKRLTFKY
jgi:Membrane proteins related to metalloendopeptidases